MATNGDARLKAVLPRLADLYSQTSYAIDHASSLREPLGSGDSIEVPSMATLTVVADGASPGSTPNQDPSLSVLTLSANLEPAIFIKLKQLDDIQLLDGNYAGEVARQAAVMLKNDMDNSFLNYLAKTLNYDSSATYTDNVASDALDEPDILNAMSALLTNKGTQLENLALFLHPYAAGSLMAIPSFSFVQPDAVQGHLGIPMIGRCFGIPCFVSQNVQRLRTVAVTASNVASNVATLTVASGHGIVPGMKIQTTGLSTNLTSDTSVTSVTATTVVVALTASNGSISTGTITIRACENVMADMSHVFVAQQMMPKARIVPYFESTADSLQISSIWGRIGRAGRSRSILSPPSSVI